MHVSGSFPISAARAYGVAPARSSRPASSVPAAAPLARLQPADRVDVSTPGSNIDRLVAARVSGPALPSATPPLPAVARATGAYQLYTRAADKIEAATAVQLGRALDVRA